MRLQCAVCKRVPGNGERYVEISSAVRTEGGVRQGVSLMVCQCHISHEMIHALGLDGQTFEDDQILVDRLIYGKES